MIVAIDSGLASIKVKLLPSFAATAPVVPEPAKKSRTRSPGLELAEITLRKMPSGF